MRGYYESLATVSRLLCVPLAMSVASCRKTVAVQWDRGLIHGFLLVITWLLIACDTAFYAIVSHVIGRYEHFTDQLRFTQTVDITANDNAGFDDFESASNDCRYNTQLITLVSMALSQRATTVDTTSNDNAGFDGFELASIDCRYNTQW